MLTLPGGFVAEMVAHAREEVPNECCGIIAGQDGGAVKLFRARNSEASPYRYNVDLRDLYRIYRLCDQEDWEFLAIYHSHPASEAYPSPTDISLAFWPDALYVIVSLMQPDAPVVRAFRIVDGAVREASGRRIATVPPERPRIHAPLLFPAGGAPCVGLISTAGPPALPTISARGPQAGTSAAGSVLTVPATGTSRPSSPSASRSISANTESVSPITPSPGGAGITS